MRTQQSNSELKTEKLQGHNKQDGRNAERKNKNNIEDIL